MVTLISLTVLAIASFIAEASCQRLVLPISAYDPSNGGPKIILPTYRPPPQSKPIIRTVREVNNEPQWLWKGDDIPRAPATGDHPFLPPHIDDVKLDPNRRYARSVDSPSAKRHGGHSSSGGRRDTGPTHPGYNRRNTRSIRMLHSDFEIDPLRTTLPRPYDPLKPRPSSPRGPYPTYIRIARDINIPGVKKPSHRDVIIPNWNPNARTNPWNRIVGKGRNPRSAEVFDNEDDIYLGYGKKTNHEV